MSSATKKIFAKMRATPPERPPNPTSSAVDTTLELSKTVLTIVQDVSGVFVNFPYVGAVASVIQQFITIRNEIKANETLCHQIIDKVLRRSKSICDDLATIANSDAKDRLIKLEGSLREYESELQAALDKLKRHQARNRWDKVVNRGLDELNETARRLDEFNLELMVRILVDIKTELAAVANRVDKIEVTEPVAQKMSDETKHVLPPRPHIMVEREGQLKIALDILLRDEPSRIAILGGGGFGKTTLARTILHDAKVAERYESRYFLSCEAFTGVDSLLLRIGNMLDIQASSTAMLASIRRRLEASTALLCLDNFETPWEPYSTHTQVEDLLASIADIPNLSLIITTRGTQRPSKVAWSHPLLPPLSTISSESARIIVQTICGPDHIIDEPTQNLLDAVDGIPLAITLISNLLRDGETSYLLWTRWVKQETKIVENGSDDRESNLNASIALSVYGPRMKKDPGAMALLAALSLLPDGFPFANIEQLGKYLDIDDIHKAVQTLRTVALIKPNEAIQFPRIQMLSPIRLFCLSFLSSETLLVLENMANYYISIMLRDMNYTDAVLYARVVPEIQNIHSVFQRAFKAGYSQDITRLIDATSYLTEWSEYIGYLSQDTIQMALEASVNFPIPHAKCLRSLGRLYATEGHYAKAEICCREASALYKQAQYVDGEAEALERSGTMLFYLGQLDQSEVAFKTSLELFTKTGNTWGQAHVRQGLGKMYNRQGRISEAQATLSDALEAYQQISDLLGSANVANILSILHFSNGNLVKAEKYATEALNIAKQANYALGEGNAFGILGRIYLARDRVLDAMQALEQALILFKQQNNSPTQLIAINDLAEVHIRSDQLSAAEALLTASSKVDLDVEQIPTILATLGWLYICGDRLDKAEPFLDNALQHFRRFNLKGRQAEVLGYLGTVYIKSDRLDEAERVLKSIPDLGTWNFIEIHRLLVLGDVYIFKGELEDAEASLDAAMAQCQNSGFTRSYERGNILRSMGTLHMKQHCTDLAIDKFKEAREFHRKAQWVSEQATDLKRLGEAYAMLERAEEAEEAFREADELMESVREARTLKE